MSFLINILKETTWKSSILELWINSFWALYLAHCALYGDDLKYEYNLREKDGLEYEGNLIYEDDLKYKDNLNYEDNLN